MKNTFIFSAILLISVTLTSCDKTTSVHVYPISINDITGKWLLVSGSGGISGGPIAVTDHVSTYTFNADSTFTFTPGQRAGKFHISMVKSIYDGQNHAYVTFSDYPDHGSLVNVKSDTLTMADNHPDGYTYMYVKVK